MSGDVVSFTCWGKVVLMGWIFSGASHLACHRASTCAILSLSNLAHASPLPQRGSFPQAAVLQEKICSTMVFPGAAGESLLGHPEVFLPLWPGCPQGSFFTLFFLTPGSCAVFPFFNLLPQRLHQCRWWAQPCPAVGLLWNWLEPVGTSRVRHEAALTSPHRDSRQHLGRGTWYTKYQVY